MLNFRGNTCVEATCWGEVCDLKILPTSENPRPHNSKAMDLAKILHIVLATNVYGSVKICMA